MVLVRNLQSGKISHKVNLVFDDYFETVHAGEDQEPPCWSELITIKSLKIAYDDEDYVPNLTDKWLDPSALEAIRHQEDHTS